MSSVATPTPPPPVLTVEELRAFLGDSFPQMAAQFEVHEVTDLGVMLRLQVGDQHFRPGGTVSGPTMMGMADGAAWLATLSRIGPVALAVTSSLTINFLAKPALSGELFAYGDLLRLGRRLSVCDVRIVSRLSATESLLVAQASVTYAIPA